MDNRIRCWLLTFGFSFAFPLALLAGEGGAGSSGGGDSIAAEFTNSAYQALNILEQQGAPGIDLSKIQLAVRSTLVRSKEHLFLDEKEVEAINIPREKLIEVSRSLWSKNRVNPRSKYVLVFHEYLRVAGYDDSSYQISRVLFNTAKKVLSVNCESLSDLEPFFPGRKLTSKLIWFEDALYGTIIDKDGDEVLDSSGRSYVIATLGDTGKEAAVNLAVSLFGLNLQVISIPVQGLLSEERHEQGSLSVKAYLVGNPEKLEATTINCNYKKY